MLCSIGYLQAEGDWKNLTRILDFFVGNEDDFRKAYETLLQGYLFCGYPRAIESFFCLKEVLNNRGKDYMDKLKSRPFAGNADMIKRGNSLSKKIHKDKSPKIKNKIGDICPDLGYLMIAEGYGHVLSRDGLDLKNRELAVVASLISLKAHRQLHSHIRGARNVGCHDLEIYEAIITGVIWVNPGKIRRAVTLWTEITGRESPDSIDNNIYSRV
jgi:4-carboxymuconolactone decarboxylase